MRRKFSALLAVAAVACPTMKSLKRVGKQPQKYVFTLNICDVRGLPADCGTVALSWQRGERTVHSPSVTAQGSGSERGARIDAKLTQLATLYARNDRFDTKPSTLRVVRHDASGKPTELGHAELDLAEYVPSQENGSGQPEQVRQILMTPPKGSGLTEQCLVQLSVAAQTMAAATDAAMSEGTPSEAGDATGGAGGGIDGASSRKGASALTHEALVALEAQQAANGKGKASRTTLSFPRGSASAGATSKAAQAAQAQAAQLAQLLQDAQADARQAESRVSTLQHRLRVEVLQSTEEVLESAGAVKHPSELAKIYLRQLQQVLDQVDRIAYDDGGQVGGGGGITSLEAEVLQLRRDLATCKVELAELTCEKAELEHVARRLNKQLAELAALNLR